MIDSVTVKKLARECGADLVGIAGVDRFAELEAEANPLAIKDDTRSIIVLGFQVLRGSLRGIEVGSSWGTFGMASPLSVLVDDTYRFCRRLEQQGFECVPLFKHDAELRRGGVAVAPDRPEPDVILDLDYAAFAAGLGHLGKGKFFLTPEFGPRQVFTAILTDAELQADPLFAGAVCDGCGDCITMCPARALDPDRETCVQLPAGEMCWQSLHIESCRVCRTGATDNPYSLGGEPWRLGAACGRACVAHLEATGRLSKALNSSFREPGE